jgi:hypothetical protein
MNLEKIILSSLSEIKINLLLFAEEGPQKKARPGSPSNFSASTQRIPAP